MDQKESHLRQWEVKCPHISTEVYQEGHKFDMLGLFSLTISSLQASRAGLRSGRMHAQKIDLEKEGKKGEGKARK